MRTSLALMMTLAGVLLTAEAQDVGVVSHILVTTDNVADVSSMEAWKRSFIQNGMTDREKALAVWKTVVGFRHQDAPPNEFLQGESNVHDAIKTFNVYGYGMCCCASANIEALARYVGLPARGRIIRGHSVPEVYWDDAWHLLDASLINYFPRADGRIAGVDEIMVGVRTWYDAHPEFRGNDGKLRQFMRNGGWRNGPKTLSRCPFYDNNGWLPAATHGWYSTMQEYDGSANGIYEYGYSQGYQVNVQLRPGERLTRCWHNKGLHVNMKAGGVGCLKGKSGQEQMRYAPAYGDLAPGRIGNGRHEYDVPLAHGVFRSGALVCENLVVGAGDGQSPAVKVNDADRPGVLVLRMPSSYVYLNGSLDLDAVVPEGGRITVSLSDNNGLDWTELRRITASGAANLDLGPFVFRRYDYRIRFELAGTGTGLNRVRIGHDVQHSQRALPALVKGANTVRFCAAPSEGTITVEGSTDPANKERQLVTSDFHARLNGVREHLLRVEGGQGTVTFPIETPGDMVRLRLGAHFRARDKRDIWNLQASFDGGTTFRDLGALEGPTPGSSHYITVDDIPPRTRSALIRFSGTQRNTTCIFTYRIDADYREPHGGFRPVRIGSEWKENGQVRRHEHVARSPRETYTIRCDGKPSMLSLALELAEGGEQRALEAASGRALQPRSRPENLPVPVGVPLLEESTLHSLGVYWPISGNANRNAEVTLHVRRQSESTWLECMPLFRVETGAHLPPNGKARVMLPPGARLFAGSALLLDPDSNYELRLCLADPDAPAVEHIIAARTIAEPTLPATMRTVHVTPGTGGGWAFRRGNPSPWGYVRSRHAAIGGSLAGGERRTGCRYAAARLWREG